MRARFGKRSLPKLGAKQQSPILHPASPALAAPIIEHLQLAWRGGKGWEDEPSSPLTPRPRLSNHTHPNTLVLFPAGSRPAFGDIKGWRGNRCPWERVPVANRPRKQNHVPATSLEIAWLRLAAPGSPPAARLKAALRYPAFSPRAPQAGRLWVFLLISQTQLFPSKPPAARLSAHSRDSALVARRLFEDPGTGAGGSLPSAPLRGTPAPPAPPAARKSSRKSHSSPQTPARLQS